MTVRSETDNLSTRKPARLHRESGASLVEVLVVMVVLLVGIFTFVRIFPTGFEVLQMSANETVAHRLAQAEVEFWRKNSENLPEGIVPIRPGPPGYSQFEPAARPNDFTSGTGAYGDFSTLRDDVRSQLSGNVSEGEIDRWVGANRQRRILGEITRIPAPSPVEGGSEQFASVYTLAYAPIDWVPGGNPSDQHIADQYLQIRGNPLESVDITGLAGDALTQALLALDQRQYGINYRDAVVYFPRSNRPRYFLASYSYRTTDGGLKTVRADRLVVPPTQTNPRGGQLPASSVTLGVRAEGSPDYANLNVFRGIEPGTEDISPKFRYLADNQPFSNDREDPFSIYEYKVLSKYALGAAFTAGIAFNPRGFRERETVRGLTVPLQARIDYLVKDWRILRQDVTLPTGNAPYRTRVALPLLKEAGVTTEADSLEPWPGMGSAGQQISVLAIDTANGNLAVNNRGNSGDGIAVDYRTGTMTFPQNLTVYRPSGNTARVDPAGRSFRIFYSVVGEWAVVPQKAYLNYDVVNFQAARGSNNFTLPIGTATVAPLDTDETENERQLVRVLFPTVDEGKAVNLNYSYLATNGQMKAVNGEEYQLSSQSRVTAGADWFYKATNNVAEPPKPYIMVKLPGDAQVSNVNTDFILNQVRGVSFRAVTVWRDRTRWRQRAVTTHLTRSAI